jgi:hypothetical protein
MISLKVSSVRVRSLAFKNFPQNAAIWNLTIHPLTTLLSSL